MLFQCYIKIILGVHNIDIQLRSISRSFAVSGMVLKTTKKFVLIFSVGQNNGLATSECSVQW